MGTLYRRLVTYFYRRFPAPPALGASRNRPFPQAVASEPPVETIYTAACVNLLKYVLFIYFLINLFIYLFIYYFIVII